MTPLASYDVPYATTAVKCRSGIGRAAFEYTRDTLAKHGVKMEYGKPRWQLTTVQADLLEMEAQIKAAWLLTLKAAALLGGPVSASPPAPSTSTLTS